MDLRVLILLPLIAVVAYTILRLAVGRPVLSRNFNITFSLLVLAYFLITAGLGIFWVANQELPVFDVHYLFGYATLVLVVVHVALNWQAISAFLRRLMPGATVQHDRRRWRPAVRALGWTVALALFALVFFWLGLQRGAQKVEVTLAERPPQETPAMTAEEKSQGPPAREPAAEPSAFQAAQRQMVTADGVEQPLAVYYHQQTEHTRAKLLARAAPLDLSTRPRVFKRYPDAQVIDLPEPRREGAASVGEAIEATRRPAFGFASDAINMEQLSTLLAMTNGVTATLRYPGRTYHLRAAPSAGALYPTVTYVLARNVEGLPAGVYHYSVKDHKLHQLRVSKTLAGELSSLTAHAQSVKDAPATFIFTTVYFRSGWKYRDRSYRYCCMDAGHLAVQTALTASALGLSSRMIGRFDDGRVNAWLALNENQEGALLIMPVGRPSAAATPPHAEPAFVASSRQLSGERNPIALLAHGSTCLAVADRRVRPPEPRQPIDKPYPDLPVIPLPERFPAGDELLGVIEARRSVREWAGQPLSLEQLASLLHYSAGLIRLDEAAVFDPSVEDNHALHVYALVNAADGLEQGIYYYRRTEHALTQIKRGSFQRHGYRASLSQDAVGRCAVAVIMTIDTNRVGWPDGDRGYRYAAMDAGMLGGRLYLQAGGLGLGCCGIGAFFDDQVGELIGVADDQELVVYMVALGVKAAGVD